MLEHNTHAWPFQLCTQGLGSGGGAVLPENGAPAF